MKTLQDFLLLAQDDFERNIASEMDNQPILNNRFSKNYNYRKKQILNKYHKKLTLSGIRWAFVFALLIAIATLSFRHWNNYNIKIK